MHGNLHTKFMNIKKKRAETQVSFSPYCMLLAEKERFELSVEVSPHNRLAGGPFQPLMHFSTLPHFGGGGRIRTHEALTPNGFQDRRLQPLGHSSKNQPKQYNIPFLMGQLKN